MTKRIARKLIVGGWWWDRSVSPKLLEEEDQSWGWEEAAGEIHQELNSGEGSMRRCYAVITTEGRSLLAEGAILYRLNAASILNPGGGAVFVEWVASAPRNRRHLVGQNIRLSGVGENLITIAIADSVYNGFNGHVALSPLDKSVGFYEKMRFERVIDPEDGRSYYEIGGDVAKAHIRLRGWEL